MKCEAQHSCRQLSPDEEHTLAKWVQCLSSTGHPVYHLFLHELAEEIWKPYVTMDELVVDPWHRQLSKHWISCFFACNSILQPKVAKNIEAAYKKATEVQLENRFEEFIQVGDKYSVVWRLILHRFICLARIGIFGTLARQSSQIQQVNSCEDLQNPQIRICGSLQFAGG